VHKWLPYANGSRQRAVIRVKNRQKRTARVMDMDDELTRLRELERATLTACKVCSDAKCLQSVLDAEYMRLRMSIVDTFERVALLHRLWWETVEYAIAWNDAYRARDKPTARLPFYLAAIACLSLAIKYTTVQKIRHCELVVECVYTVSTHAGSRSQTHTRWNSQTSRSRLPSTTLPPCSTGRWVLRSLRDFSKYFLPSTCKQATTRPKE
jgi:hypothetical protein